MHLGAGAGDLLLVIYVVAASQLNFYICGVDIHTNCCHPYHVLYCIDIILKNCLFAYSKGRFNKSFNSLK